MGWKGNRCACCDTEAANLNIIEAFTLGAGLGERGLDALRATLCTTHRIAHVKSMATLRAKVDALVATQRQSKDGQE